MLLPDETLEELAAGLKIIQPAAGYRYSLDPFLLCAFTRLPPNASVADLGTGSGIIPLLLAARQKTMRLVGVEIEPAAADRARRSVELNGLAGQVQIVPGDVRWIRDLLPPQSFDVVLANPPYREPERGRVAAAARGAARHELSGDLADFLRAGAFLLKDGGRFAVVFLAERLAELLVAMHRERLAPKRLRFVHARPGEGARLVLVEGRKRGGAGVAVEAPLFTHEGGEFSSEMRRIYAATAGAERPDAL